MPENKPVDDMSDIMKARLEAAQRLQLEKELDGVTPIPLDSAEIHRIVEGVLATENKALRARLAEAEARVRELEAEVATLNEAAACVYEALLRASPTPPQPR